MDNIKSIKYRSEYKKDEGVEILSMDDFFTPKSIKTIMKPYRIKFYNIMYISDGEGIHDIDFRKKRVGKGDLILVSKDRVHNFSDVNNIKGVSILMSDEYLIKGFGKDRELILKIFEQTRLKPYINLKDDIVVNQFHFIKKLFEMELGSRTLSSALTTLFLSLYQLYIPTDTLLRSDTMKALENLLKQNIKNSHAVKDYAEKMNMSTKSLNRLVQKEYGKTVKSFIQDQLLYEIKYRLCFTDLTLQEIAYHLGFNEPSHMTNFFKKSEGVSPTIYRRSQRLK